MPSRALASTHTLRSDLYATQAVVHQPTEQTTTTDTSRTGELEAYYGTVECQELSLGQWIRHMLNYHDGRFKTDPSSIYVAYTLLQRRERLQRERLLCKKVFSNTATNSVTSAELKEYLASLSTKQTLYNQGPANRTIL